MNWWGNSFCLPHSLADLFWQWSSLINGKFQKKFWIILFMSALWTLWLSRNDKVFNSKSISQSTLLSLVFSRACFWINSIKGFNCLKGEILNFDAGHVRLLRSSSSITPLSYWKPPPNSTLKWNTDGSSYLNTQMECKWVFESKSSQSEVGVFFETITIQ